MKGQGAVWCKSCGVYEERPVSATCVWCGKVRIDIMSVHVEWFCGGLEGCGIFNPLIKPPAGVKGVEI